MEEWECGKGESAVQRAQETLRARLDQRRQRDCKLSDSEPSASASNVLGYTHTSHWLDSQVAKDLSMLAPFLATLFFWYLSFPEQITNKMVLADVFREEINTLSVGEAVEMGFAEHGRFADNAGRNQDGIDGSVEFCMCRRHEQFFDPSTTFAQGIQGGTVGRSQLVASSTGRNDSEIAVRVATLKETLSALGNRCARNIDDQWQKMDEFVLDASVADQCVDHSSTSTLVDPDVAVDDPNDIAFGFSVCPTHVSDFGVGSESCACIVAL